MNIQLINAIIESFESSRDLALVLDQEINNNPDYQEIKSYLYDIVPELEFMIEELRELV